MKTTHLDNQPVNYTSKHDNPSFETVVKMAVADLGLDANDARGQDRPGAISYILTAHQAALAARDAEWIAAVEELKVGEVLMEDDMGGYSTVISTDAVDALLTKFKGGK